MSTNYPDALDNLNNPAGTDSLSGHAALHSNTNDAIEALQLKVGVDGSSDINSIDYKITSIEASVNSISNNSDAISELLGLEGNNDLAVYGIENPTNVDSFAKNTWKTVKYALQVTKGLDVYASEILATQSGSDVLVSETNIVSNTNNSLFTYTFEENSGIISLRITPVSGEIAVRFVRTALKV
jgi:hypothetical protein